MIFADLTIIMTSRGQHLQCLREISMNSSLNKASTIGVVIDSSSVYLDGTRNVYTLKLLLIDENYNICNFNPLDQNTYLSVYYSSDKSPNKLPIVEMLGDIIYLKRYKFKKNYHQFQGFHQFFSSWTLFRGGTQSLFEPYLTSKKSISFKQLQEECIITRLKQLKIFTQEYLSKYSLISIHPYFTHYSKDIIVQVLRKCKEQGYILTDRKKQYQMEFIDSAAQEGDFAKLRSINIERGSKRIIKNRYSSLIPIPNDCLDAIQIQNKNLEIKKEDHKQYTSLSTLKTISLEQSRRKSYNVKVSVWKVYPKDYQNAIHLFNPETKTLLQCIPSMDLRSVLHQFRMCYIVRLVCKDVLDKQYQFYDLMIYSHDSQCNNFVPNVDPDFNCRGFSNFEEENYLYKERVQSLINASSVTMIVEVCFTPDRNKKMLRVLSVDDIT